MNDNTHHPHAVPTNIITGFLGVGKTSAILHLLSQKPAHERWAVLVNEFGEIGVDGSLLNGQYSKEQGIFIREVPGGCMCCASGLPMQIALNQLLSKAKPDRLLIEPTGLGHPKEVLQVLSAEYYKKVLSVQKTLTLVDGKIGNQDLAEKVNLSSSPCWRRVRKLEDSGVIDSYVAMLRLISR
jgi:G3E family GTPase